MLQISASISALLLPLSMALCCGMILGVERELAHKPAGLRTQALITLGSTVFVLTGLRFGAEPIRIAANVITGLGFLGAGVVLQHQGAVRGMTTSALIWVNGSLGVAIGLGQYQLAIFGLLFALIALSLLGLFERLMKTKCQIVQYVVTTSGGEHATNIVEEALRHSHYQDGNLSFGRENDKLTLKFGFCNQPKRHRDFVDKLRELPEVLSVESKS